MKKLLVVVLVALCAVFSVNALMPEFGVKAGMTLGNVARGDSEAISADNPLKFGLTGGLTMDMSVGPLALGAELLYTQKGEKITDGDVAEYLSLSYIEVPVMAKFSVFPLIKMYGGLNMGFLVSAENSVDVDGEEVVSADIKDSMTSTDLGLIVGVQVKISKLVFDARYNHGLTDIVKDNEGDALQLRTLYATVGLSF